MTMTATKSMVGITVPSPCEMPNGLQWYGDELFVMDQLTDNVYVIDEAGTVPQNRLHRHRKRLRSHRRRRSHLDRIERHHLLPPLPQHRHPPGLRLQARYGHWRNR